MAVEKVPYGGWQNCYKVNNGVVELVATADVGPRFIRFGFVGGENEFAEIPEQLGLTGSDVSEIMAGTDFGTHLRSKSELTTLTMNQWK
jgi:hypothetical protein